MKKLSDYTGDEAIDLWADLLDPISEILTDTEVADAVRDGNNSKLDVVKVVLKNHSKEATEILLRIDPEPVNGLNIIVRLVALVAEIGSNPEASAFFGFAGQAKTDSVSSGSVTESTEAKEK